MAVAVAPVEREGVVVLVRRPREQMLEDEAPAMLDKGAAQNNACARRGPVPQYEQDHRRA
ncbi:hypothetical protein N7524_006702 [Penicillium chrysogenum]|nr:hypothetical protein N7524_006702 [Penicillium chrysogenum]